MAVTTINDTDELKRPSGWGFLVGRIRELSTQRYTTEWMQVEIAAIASLLDEGAIKAGQVWQLVLVHYNIASSVSSTPDPANASDWLTLPLADRAMVWEHLTALCAGQKPAPVPTLPAPYDDHGTPEITVLLDQVLGSHARALNTLHTRLNGLVDGRDFFSRLNYELRHSVEHNLAVQWFGGTLAIGASLHGVPRPGGSLGLDDQPVYVLKALVAALKRDIVDHEDACLVNSGAQLSCEIRGRIDLWWSFVKGYTYDMVHTRQGRIVVAMLRKHPELVNDLKLVLKRGLAIINSDLPKTPVWGARGDCEMYFKIASMPTDELIEKLNLRLIEEAQHRLKGLL